MSTEFTAYRFKKRNGDCAMHFIALHDNGFTPVWREEALSKRHPEAKRALLINLPVTEREKFREYSLNK